MPAKEICAYCVEYRIRENVTTRVIWPTKHRAKKHVAGLRRHRGPTTYTIVPIHAIIGFFNERSYQ